MVLAALTTLVCAYGGGGYGGGGGFGAGGMGVIQAAIQSRHNVQFYDVPSSGMINPTTIEGLYYFVFVG